MVRPVLQLPKSPRTVRDAPMRRACRCVIALPLAGVMAWSSVAVAAPAGPAPAAEAPAAQPSAPTAAEPSAPAAQPTAAPQASGEMAEIKKIYASGKVKYETKDYAGAIADWTEALGRLPQTPENQEIRNDLVYNIASAQERAYDIDKDVAHLRTARALLADFLETYKTLYRPDEQTVAEFKRVNERIAGLDARIAEAEAAGPPPTRRVEKRLDLEVKQALQNDPVLWKQYKQGRSMITGGAVALGVGGGFLLVAAAVAPAGTDSVGDERRDARTLAISLAIVGVAGIVGGAVLVGLGVPKKRAAKEEAVRRVVVHPTFGVGGGGGFVGLGARARF